MASEYLQWKYRDVKPAEKIELTPRQKRRNWWHYHKWHVLIGAALACAGMSLALTMLGVGRVDPDYQFACVTSEPLPDDAAEALEAALSTLGEDCNGDGRVVVRLNRYALGNADAADSTNAYYAMAATTKIMADLAGRESYFFLMEDPEAFQRGYGALRRLDGANPAEGDADWQSCCLRWTDCPALNELALGSYEERALGQERSGEIRPLLEGMYVARRGFWTDETCAHVEACDALWGRIVEGART